MSDQNGDKNPWLSIPAADYEAHMGGPGVGQLQFLSEVLRETLDRFRPRSIAVLGCATGNGFEHIDPGVTEEVIGIDINPDYIAIVQSRFGSTIPGLRLLCSDITSCSLDPRCLDLIHCGLVLEYVEPRIVVEKAGVWLRSGGLLSVVLQLESAGHAKVTNTGFTSLGRLEPAMRLVDPGDLGRLIRAKGFSVVSSRVDTLETGKTFHVGVYRLET